MMFIPKIKKNEKMSLIMNRIEKKNVMRKTIEFTALTRQ